MHSTNAKNISSFILNSIREALEKEEYEVLLKYPWQVLRLWQSVF